MVKLTKTLTDTEEVAMNFSIPNLACQPGVDGFVFSLGSLAAALTKVPDRRKRRGVRFALPIVLLVIVLAKLGGEDEVTGIAEWAQARAEWLGSALGLQRRGLPHRTTYGRILAKGLEWADLERVASEFLTQQPRTEAAVVVSLDGKTLRGTIAAGETRGVHLLAAYLPEAGVVLLQVDVGTKENEIPAALRVLQLLDLNGKIVRGDAIFTQRGLSAQIVAEGGEYVWIVKENQPQLRADIVTAFTPPPLSKGFSAGPTDFQSATTVNKAHGRMETRRLTTTGSLNGFLDWPGVAQVFQLERTAVENRTAQVRQETVYGLTSLTRDEADPCRLLDLVRVHWGIENGLPYRRDVTFHEDACGLESNPAQRILSTINNLVLGLLLSRGVQNVPSARRRFNAQPQQALALLVGST